MPGSGAYNRTNILLIEKIGARPIILLSLGNLNFTKSIPYAMKPLFLWASLLLFALPSLANEKACEYAGSNISFIKSQTQKAIAAQDINLSRYHAYKALNAIEKSREQFEACNCEYANKSIFESMENLKRATKVSSLNGTKILLRRALDHALGSLEALEKHEELHGSRYASDVLAVNTKSAGQRRMAMKLPESSALRKQIDEALVNYEKSLAEVVRSVDCKDAFAFANRIYRHCEAELLKPDLTEAKRYYNLRTKQITARALDELKQCVTF